MTEIRYEPLGGLETDYDDEDVLVMKDDLGRASVVPRSLRKLDPEIRQEVRGLMDAAMRVQDAQDDVGARVAELRDQGVPWSAIGWAVGTSGDAARKRWAGELED